MFISTRSVENWISVERLNTLNTDLIQFCKTSEKFQPAKQGLFSLIPEAAVHMNFAVNLARSFRTPILYYIDNHIQNRCFAKSTGKQLCWNLFLIKLQSSGLQLLKRHLITGVFSEFWKISENIFVTEHLRATA